MCCECKVILKKIRELLIELVWVLLKFEYKGCVEDNFEVEGMSDRWKGWLGNDGFENCLKGK